MSNLIFVAGVIQLCILTASALVPFQLDWKEVFQGLPKLHRQLYWVYGGYVVLGIISNGLICIFNANALADHSLLSRCVCGYMTAFWGIRLGLQRVLDVNEFLTNHFLRVGYHALTVAFTLLTIILGYAALG